MKQKKQKKHWYVNSSVHHELQISNVVILNYIALLTADVLHVNSYNNTRTTHNSLLLLYVS